MSLFLLAKQSNKICAVLICLFACRFNAADRFQAKGQVVDSSGNAITGATVVLVNNGNDPPVNWDKPEANALAISTTTGEGGRFLFHNVQAGTYWLYSRNSDGETHVRRIGFHDEAPEPYSLQLSRTVLEGTVRAGTQGPIDNATVALDYSSFITKADSDGRFRFRGIASGEYKVVVTAKVTPTQDEMRTIDNFRKGDPGVLERMENIRATKKVNIAENRITRVQIELPDAVVRGTVLTPQGTPVEGACVLGGGRAAFTNGKGEFKLTRIEPGNCSIQVQGKNGEIRNVKAEARLENRASPVKVTLYPFRPSVVFHFIDVHGKPVANRTLLYSSIKGTGREKGGLRTDDHGEWKRTLMDSGRLHYVFGWPSLGYSEQMVNVEEGVRETHSVVELEESTTVKGTVREAGTLNPLGGTVLTPIRVGPDGQYDERHPWNGLFIALHSRFVNGYPITGVSKDGDGTYSLPNLPPGKYGIIAVNGTRRAEVDISVVDGNEMFGIDVVLPAESKPRSISGRVLTPNGSPLENIEVEFVVDTDAPSSPMYGPLGGVPRTVVTDDDGRFRLSPVDSHYGDYWLTAKTPGFHASETKKVNVSKQSVAGLEFVVRATEESPD